MLKLLVSLAVVALSALPLAAETVEALDARLTKELHEIDPEAATLWTKANAARAAGKDEEAVRLYEMVYTRVPAFDHAVRRQAAEENSLGRHAEAIDHGRAAVALIRSPMNLAALARILVEIPKGGTRSAAEMNEAEALANEAVALQPNDEDAHTARALVSFATEDIAMLRDSATQLERLAPNDAQTHVFAFYASASEGKFTAAQASLDRARALGLPAETYDTMLGQLHSAMPFYMRWWKPAAIALAIWFGCFALLLGAGVLLSRIAFRAAREVPADLAANATGLGSRLRRVYGAVLFLSSLFYYASVPVVIGLVLLVGGSLIYGAFAIGHIPVKLVAIALMLVVISIWSIVKSLFIRAHDGDPGMKLELEKHPRLRALLDEVAARIGTRSVDNVYLTPATEVAVMERKKGKERCLILGVAGLDGLAIRPLKAVLGHEYGHFTNRDTAGGAFALRVRNSVSATAYALATGGAAAWYNPAWLFVNGFHRVFLRISEGSSRLQEVLADRWAVFAYGADAFEAGLRHVVARGVHFDAHVGATLKEVVDGQLPLTNLYTYQPAKAGRDVDSAVEEALQRQTSAYDSHPSPAERFALVHALPRHGTAPDSGDDAPAWSLFDDVLELQRAMTAKVRENVRANYGIEIAAEAVPAT